MAKKVTKKKVAKKRVTKKTKPVRRTPRHKPEGESMAPKDLRMILTGLENWVRYTRELIAALPEGTVIEPPEHTLPPTSPPPPPILAGMCGPRPIGPIGPDGLGKVPGEIVCRILGDVENGLRLVSGLIKTLPPGTRMNWPGKI